MAMRKHYGVDPASVELINVNFPLTPTLMSGQVDAVAGAFRYFYLGQMRIHDRVGRCFNPEDNSVPACDALTDHANPKSMRAAAICRFLRAVSGFRGFHGPHEVGPEGPRGRRYHGDLNAN